MSTKTRTFTKSVLYHAMVVPIDVVILTVLAVAGFHVEWTFATITLTVTTIGIEVIHTFLLYFYDRAWKKVKWGKTDTLK